LGGECFAIYTKIFEYTLVTLIGIVLLNLLTTNYFALDEASRNVDITRLYQLHAIKVFYGFLFGILINYRTIVKYFGGNIGPNLTLLPGLVLLAISLVPPIHILYQFGINMPMGMGSPGLNYLFAPLQYSSTSQLMLSLIAGILISRGFYQPKNNN
jgi:hypothetical protein